MKKLAFASIVVLLVVASCSKKSSPTGEKAINGEHVFTANCYHCHHRDENVPGKAPNLATIKLTKDEINAVVMKGHGHMPAFEDKLTTKEIAAVSDYVYSLQKK